MSRRVTHHVGRRLACAVLGALVVVPGAQAADNKLFVGKVDTSRFPEVRVAFSKDDNDAGIPNLTVVENGQEIDHSAYAGKLGSTAREQKNVLYLVVDASKTMRGRKIDQARAAAKQLIDEAREGDRLGLVSFGKSANLVVEATDDFTALSRKLGAIKITNGTKMYDAIKLASESFPADATRRVLVVLTDGAEIGSKTTLAGAIAAARANKVEVVTVGIKGKVFAPAPLVKMSKSTGGSFHAVRKASQLSLLYEQLGRELLNSYWLSYRSKQGGKQLTVLELKARGFGEGSRSFTTPAAADASLALEAPPLKTVSPDRPLIPLPGGMGGALLPALAAGLATMLLALTLVFKPRELPLARRIEPYTRAANPGTSTDNDKGKGDNALTPLFSATESVLGTSGFFRHLASTLDRARVPMREVEFLYLMVGSGLLVTLVAAGFLPGMARIAPVFVGPLLPYLWLKLRIRKRSKMFEEQLADVLSSVSASLKAGHSFNQALATVIKQAPNPMAEELQRALAEARLGLPMEDALEGVAQRLNSRNFEFAVTVVNIQRQVGGSLAEILETVSETVRNRQQFKKKVKALTSMGRMSAYVLLAMPFFIAGIFTLINPSYMAPLFTTPTGHKLIVATLVFMAMGGVACQKIVSFKT